MRYNKKKLTACALTAILGVSCAVYPVHAQETGTSQQSDTGELLELDETAVSMDETTIEKPVNTESNIEIQDSEPASQEQAETKDNADISASEPEQAEGTANMNESAVQPDQQPENSIMPYTVAPAPTFTTTQTASTIKVTVTNYQYEYGLPQYKIDGGKWRDWGTFENLKSNSSHTIEVKFRGREETGYTESEVVSQSASTTNADFTITIPAVNLIAGDKNSTANITVDDTKNFDLGYSGQIDVKIKVGDNVTNDAKLKLENTKKTITSALIVNGKELGNIDTSIATFTMKDKTPVSISFAQPTETNIPAGTYNGTMTFAVSYSEQ